MLRLVEPEARASPLHNGGRAEEICPYEPQLRLTTYFLCPLDLQPAPWSAIGWAVPFPLGAPVP